MNKKKVILWFRSDLRLHDNEALVDALAASDDLYPVYVFDTRIFGGKSSFGFEKTDVFRAQFIIEAVANLKQSLIRLGSDLIIRIGHPETEIYNLAKDLKTSWVFCNRERTREEVYVQDILEKDLWSIGQEVRFSRGKMLFYTSDLPFPVTHTPDTFTQFRKEVEKIVPIRTPIEAPKEIPVFEEEVDLGQVPTLADLHYKSHEHYEPSFTGGENAAIERLDHYFWKTDEIKNYKDRRNELLGLDFSSKFSVYLAHGCLSPKYIYHELKKYEASRGSTDGTYHMFFELLWRDFFRLIGKKYGNLIFVRGGIKQKRRTDLSNDLSLFRVWSEARTGMPLIDAAMTELNQTGFMSNRARQNAASFLINDLKINWQIGAEYFESKLIDYDPCSNWGNWMYLAGVGNDPRPARYFNIIKQAQKYDPNGDYVKHWIPALRKLPSDKVHQPYLLSDEEQTEYDFLMQKDYPQLCLKKADYL